MKLPQPLAGRAANARVFLVDASVEGIRIAHQGTLPAVGNPCRIELAWEGQPIVLDCVVIHNSLFRLAKGAGEKSIYHAGLRIAEANAESRAGLKQLVADCVARALDEQKANARGIPATAAQSFQTGKGNDFIRCELIDGAWRRTSTNRPEQPANGFTISAEEEREQVEMLCQTFETADAAGRKLIQTMAEMSISKSEGVPTRRYTP
ncbi:MAG TPA: PilZ domain-containing protein [Thermoanaerobaculia bacterium]|nr:PilZ domain-containing protein [Thermoanaerobaculia bacterium]